MSSSSSQRRPNSRRKSTRGDADAEEESGEEVVDAEGEGDDVVHVLGGGPSEGGDVFFGDHGVFEGGVLIVVLDDAAGEAGAFGDAEAGGEGACGDVADGDDEGDDFDFADELLAHVEASDEVGGYADLVEFRHQVFADAVVEDALAGDGAGFVAVGGGGVVLEVFGRVCRALALRRGLWPLPS